MIGVAKILEESSSTPVNVTKTFLPPKEMYDAQVSRIWESGWLTNRGPLVIELEQKLREKLQVKNILLTCNGTVPLQIALKLFGEKGEIITTPFTYIATSAAIVWENCTPVFVDIDPEFLTIDEKQIEKAITSRTTAILATHVFGNPCNVEVIGKIANRYGLKVIYDAAHCFGVQYLGNPIFNYGDVSTCSFHATKIFHTGEGGAIFCSNSKVHNAAYSYHNFGHEGPLSISGLGINGKISEIQAAMGLSVLPYYDDVVMSRKKAVNSYVHSLKGLPLKLLTIRPGTKWNYSYFPILFKNERSLLAAEKVLNGANVFPRRYFYPALSKINYLRGQEMPVAEAVAERILCLPLFADMSDEIVTKVSSAISEALK